MPTFIARSGSAVLWSWGNYRYTIDVGSSKDVVVMNDTDFEDALSALARVRNVDMKSTTKTTEQNSHFLHLLKSAQGTIGKNKLVDDWCLYG